jgi:hypothetical protein
LSDTVSTCAGARAYASANDDAKNDDPDCISFNEILDHHPVSGRMGVLNANQVGTSFASLVRVNRKRGHEMKSTRLMIAGTAVALLPLVGLAQSPDQRTQPSQPSQQGATFESLDVNSDGKISKAEAAANENVNAQFSRYDQNGDGFIERAEVNSANTTQPASPQ